MSEVDALRLQITLAEERAAFYEAEVERLRRCVDTAFRYASGGDAHLARVALTEARWGHSTTAHDLDTTPRKASQ